jgi:aryl-alcohol dehydrogenase-like predicted oxidoreductase
MHNSAVAAAGLAAGLGSVRPQNAQAANSDTVDKAATVAEKTRSYNPAMEYRRLGKTGLMVSAVALGGHWKMLPYAFGSEDFKKNRRDVVSACIDCGINYVDACADGEVVAYSEALRGRREEMFLGYSFCEHEVRYKAWQSTEKLLEGFDDLLRRAKLDYVDLWRITCYWKPSTDHTVAQEEAMVEALERARKAGKVRFTGISTHKHDWVIRMMETYPEQIQVVVVPYTAGSKDAHARVDPESYEGEDYDWKSVPAATATYDTSMLSLIDAVKKNDVGWFGIKPFASGSVFKSRGAVNPATKTIDDERARLTLRAILNNDALTAPIPGLITADQVRNAALAVTEGRTLDLAEAKVLEQTVSEMWANLPPEYQWLKREWEWV